jgi:hypothetical protein
LAEPLSGFFCVLIAIRGDDWSPVPVWSACKQEGGGTTISLKRAYYFLRADRAQSWIDIEKPV